MDPTGSAAITECLMVPLALIQSFQTEVIIFSFVTFLLLFFAFLISGGEHALFSLTSSELSDLEKEPRTFRHIQHLMARPRHLLVLVKMLQMVVNVTVLFLAVRIGIHLFGALPFPGWNTQLKLSS